MRIWIDGKEANVPQRLGSSQVAFNLIKSLEKIDKVNDYTILLPSIPDEDFPPERENWKYKILKPNRLWTIISLPLALLFAKSRPDVFFSPTHYIPRFPFIKRVVTIFDLSYLHFPQMFNRKDLWQLKNWSGYSIKNAKKVITISHFSKSDIAKNYGISKEKITVAYPGYDLANYKVIRDEEKIKKIKDSYRIDSDNYIIYIGTLQPRKNLIKLIESVARIDNLKLVIVGKTNGPGRSGWMYEDILARPKQLGIEDRVIFTGFVPPEHLSYLLSGATAFVLPSLYEGFGIPVVDAMACGVPVIVSNVSSLPEVVGSAGLLINPQSTDQIEQAIRTLVSDKKLRQKYSKEVLRQAERFSWDKMARTVKQVLEEVGR